LPLLEILKPEFLSVQCLILVPSRELALQIEKVWKQINSDYKINVSYGGHAMETELKNFSNPPAILVGTPGRIADHLERRSFRTDKIQTLILDEFDKTLQLGFKEEMSFITNHLNHVSKRILVSATHGVEIPKYTKIKNPTTLDFISNQVLKSKLNLHWIHSTDKDKINTLFQLLSSFKSESGIVFCNHREAADRISEALNTKGLYAICYHGGMEQVDRERALVQFRNKSIQFLITTDLASRGLDIPEINHIVHYHLPTKQEEFTHRNGRTARMTASGSAYIIVNDFDKEVSYLQNKKQFTDIKVSAEAPKPPFFQTVYVSGGKKDKLNKVDIVGFFMQKGLLSKEDLGLIEVKDFVSYVAVKYSKVFDLIKNTENQKMKGKKYKIELARMKPKQPRNC
jgi:ATP-dependent RNA helicase DeaD